MLVKIVKNLAAPWCVHGGLFSMVLGLFTTGIFQKHATGGYSAVKSSPVDFKFTTELLFFFVPLIFYLIYFLLYLLLPSPETFLLFQGTAADSPIRVDGGGRAVLEKGLNLEIKL